MPASKERRGQQDRDRTLSPPARSSPLAASLSPPPPRSNRSTEEEEFPVRRQRNDVKEISPGRQRPHRQLPAAASIVAISAAQAVASALSLSPAIRARVEAEAAEKERKVAMQLEEAEERWGGQKFLDLAPIAESPGSPKWSPGSKGTESKQDCTVNWASMSFESPIPSVPKELCLSASTATMSTQIGLQASSPSSSSRRALKSQLPAPRPLQIGSPVSFYLDGHPTAYFGWLKSVTGNKLYIVDLIGGGRMAGLEVVTPCTDADLRKAEQIKHRLYFSDDPYSQYDIGDKDSSTIVPASDRKFSKGEPVSFSLEKHERSHKIAVSYPQRLYGHVQQVSKDGKYVVDVAGGGRITGVSHLTLSTEQVLQKQTAKNDNARTMWKTKLDSSVQIQTRNAPAWGGACGWSSAYRERSPPAYCPTARSLSRAVSVPALKHASSASSGAKERSLSPQPRRQGGNVSGRVELQVGSTVAFFLEGIMEQVFGWIRSVDDEGKFTVECVNGRRTVGLREVVPCSLVDIDRAKKKRLAMVTRKDTMDVLETRNRPTSRSPSPIPRLRGVAINPPPRSAAQMIAT